VAALRAALAATLHHADPAADTAERAASVRRIARGLLEGEADQGPEVTAAAQQVLLAPSPALPGAAEALLGLLGHGPAESAPAREDLVLIIEDDPDLGGAFALLLAAPGRRLEIVTTAAAARVALRSERVSLVVLDLLLPDGDGRNLLVQLRSDPQTAGVPVFVVSVRLGAATQAECFALGADAYFTKPLDLGTFGAAIGARLERAADQARLTRRDPVTGLPNRAAFLESLTRRLTSETVPLAVAVLDLDHFRWVEESCGRRAAEDILRRAGGALALALPQAACFARWDGAEFIALFRGGNAAEAGRIVERALAELRRVDFNPGVGQPLRLGFSAGVAMVRPGTEPDDALSAADRLRHAAKAAGRGRVVADEPGLVLPRQRILLVEDDANIAHFLERHLNREGFDVVHCPDGAAALEALPDSGAALIVSDVDMPNLDGLGFLTRLRQLPEWRHVPVMMLTAMGDESFVVRAFELGADDYVLKPFSAREVIARIRRLLRRPSVTGLAAATGGSMD
jgi:diguanylate cyclase (GGDEF)-like protein